MIKLYDYFRSSASFRVRLALSIKQIKHDVEEIHLVKDGGQQHQTDYLKKNPQGLVPALELKEATLTQSMSILEYLEEVYPTPALLPSLPLERAYVRQLCQIISCDIHPLNNLRVLQYLKNDLHVSEAQKNQWYHHWILKGFEAFEKHLDLGARAGTYCYHDQVTMADLCLIPQVYNAYRFECPLTAFPKIEQIYKRCMALETFAKVAPE